MTLSSRCGRGRRERASSNCPRADSIAAAQFLYRNAEIPGGVFQCARFVEDVPARELTVRILAHVAVLLHPVVPAEPICDRLAQNALDFLPRPEIEGSLARDFRPDRVRAVGVLGGVETAFSVRHVASDVIEDVARDLAIARPP